MMSAVALVVLVALQGVAGAVIWGRATARRDPVEMVGMGLALGTILALFSGLILQLLGVPAWAWSLPGIVVVAWWLIRRVRGRSPVSDPVLRVEGAVWVALAVGSLLGAVFILGNLGNYPLDWTGSWTRYHPDMAFFEAVAGSIVHLGPWDSVFHPGAQIRYHWLTYAWSGQLTEVTGVAPFVVLTRVLPVVAVMAAVTIIASWSRRVSRVPWVPTLAVVLLMTGGFLGATYGGVLNFDSPSQSLGIVWLLAYSVVLSQLVLPGSDRARTAALVVMLLVLSFALGGGKVSAAAPAVAGVLLLALLAVVRREAWRARTVVAAVVTVFGVAAAYLLILSGAAGSGGLGFFNLIDRASSQQGLNPVDGVAGVIAGTGILLVAMAARWAGLGWLALAPSSRWQPMTVFGVGLAASGLVSVVVFNGLNEIWFGLAAAAPLAVLTSQGAGEAAEHLARSTGRRGSIVASCVVASAVVYGVVWMLWTTGASGGNLFVGTARWLGPLAGVALAAIGGLAVALAFTRSRRWAAAAAATVVILVFATAPGRLLGVGTGQVGVQQPGLREEWFSISTGPLVRERDGTVIGDWTSDRMDAARWLRANAGPDDLLATNLTFSPFVPGVTGMSTYVSAIQYQGPYGRPAEIPDLVEREAQVWDFIEGPSVGTIAPLCQAGVDWLWVEPAITSVRDWAPYASAAFANDDAIILRLNPEQC